MDHKIILKALNITHKYGNNISINNISFEIIEGEIISILGPSGCGKSTLLKIISGIEKIQDGILEIDQNIMSHGAYHVPTEKRKVGLVFQDLALFPHLSIRKNIEYGISYLSNDEKKQRVREMLAFVKMEKFADTYPHLLSGGQQQRVALARSLAPLPKLLLLDEPFSGLDISLRKDLGIEIKNILKKSKMTSIFVTHDANEALMLSDKIIILNNGKVEQFDTPKNIYTKPINSTVASFFGTINKIQNYQKLNNIFKISKLNNQRQDININIYFRPDALTILNEINSDSNFFEGKIIDILYYGNYISVLLSISEYGTITGYFSSANNFSIGNTLKLKINENMLFVFQENE